MASLFNELNSSDDSDDADYNPEGVIPSSDEEPEPVVNSDDEIESDKNSKRSRKRTKKSLEGETKIKSSDELKRLPVAEKKNADDLFKDFLAEVEKETAIPPQNASDSSYDSPSSSLTVVSSSVSEMTSPGVESLPEKNTELFEFAGETVSVPKEILNASVIQPKKRGLSSVLDALEKKPKLSVLNKSQIDWLAYKAEVGIDEEIKNYNRGRGGYIERQKFLGQCDQKSFEIERDMRIKKRKP